MTEDLVVAQAVTKSLGSRASGDLATPVLRGVSLRLAAGSFTAIVGPSGCGKTTFLSLLAALDVPDGGTLRVAGIDLGAASRAELEAYRRSTIGLVLQFWNLLPTLSALENVETAIEHLPLSARERRDRAAAYVDKVGLGNALGKFPAQMSGGMQQRVAIARALAREPKLLLADEPTGSLDRESGMQVFELIASLQRSLGITCVMVTHDPELADAAGAVVRFEDGQVTASPGSPR